MLARWRSRRRVFTRVVASHYVAATIDFDPDPDFDPDLDKARNLNPIPLTLPSRL